jgi:hypothetical protein
MVLLLCVLPACSDHDAAQRIETSKQFDVALANFRAADRGFVPLDVAPEKPDVLAYRRKQLDDAADSLRKLLPQADGAQKLAAHRLLADADASVASFEATRAMEAWAGLVPRTSNLLQLLVAVDRANARVAGFDTAGTESLIAELGKHRAAAQQRVEQHRATIAKLQPAIDEYKTKIAGLQKASEEAKGQSQALKTKAFTSSGETQAELYTQADQAERTANSSEAEARKQGARLEVANSEMAIATRQLELAQGALKSVQDQIAEAEASLGELRTKREGAIADRDGAIATLEQELTDVNQAYQQNVAEPLARASEKAEGALEQLRTASGLVSAANRRNVQADLLAKHAARADILTQRVIAASGYAKALAVLAGQAERLMPGRTVYKDLADRAAAMETEALNLATAAIDEAGGIATELGTDVGGSAEDPLTAFANAQSLALEQYRTRLQNLNNPPAATTQPK